MNTNNTEQWNDVCWFGEALASTGATQKKGPFQVSGEIPTHPSLGANPNPNPGEVKCPQKPGMTRNFFSFNRTRMEHMSFEITVCIVLGNGFRIHNVHLGTSSCPNDLPTLFKCTAFNPSLYHHWLPSSLPFPSHYTYIWNIDNKPGSKWQCRTQKWWRLGSSSWAGSGGRRLHAGHALCRFGWPGDGTGRWWLLQTRYLANNKGNLVSIRSGRVKDPYSLHTAETRMGSQWNSDFHLTRNKEIRP